MKELFEKYIKRECSEHELRQIIVYFKNSKDLSDVPTIEEVSKLLKDFPDMEETVANRMHENILKITKAQEHKSQKKKIYNWSYAAAAVIIGVFAASYFFNNSFNNSKSIDPVVNSTPVLPSSSIEAGTNKAVLTLEDGSVVTLGKDNKYQAKNANSNGEQIIYKNRNSNSSEIAYNYLTIPRGGQFYIVLSDGTQIWLNSESKLKYPVSFIEGFDRKVELVYGEAYFDVSPSSNHKGSKFKVLNQFQEVEVIGTEFNIKAYKDETNILTTLVEGKVSIGNGVSKQNLILNQQSKLNTENNRITVAEINVKAEISWKKGIFSFEGESLKDIMKVISRWYDVDIVFENPELKSVKFNGILDKKQSIEEILLIMKSSTINNYEIKDKKILLK
ncbi:FecR family protein [uncultured Maribacter sp.]|uniref:FecR family protein n=1 Tax=uncultured Maribacter sp. TaxID=431308 RepID=UPI00261C14C8|nr:FecR family protein [uncultured Maribacter sp.]